MALILSDRVKVNTTTVGTGTVVLASTAPTGYQTFAVIGDNNSTYYTIAGQTTTEWEVGIGTYYSANTSLSRVTIFSSSNANAIVNFSNGTKDVFVTYPSEASALGGSGQAIVVNQANATANYTIAAGTNGFSVGPIYTANNVTITITSGQRWVII